MASKMRQPSEQQAAGGSSSAEKGLTPAQIRQFKEEGLLIVRQMLPHEALQPLIDELTQQVDQAIGEATRQGLLDASRTLMTGRRLPAGWRWRPQPARTGIGCGKTIFRGGSRFRPACSRLRTSPVLLDATEALIGPEILAHPQFALRPKMPDLGPDGYSLAPGSGVPDT